MKLADVERIFAEEGTQLQRGRFFWKADDEFAVIVVFDDDNVDVTYWNDSKQTAFGKMLRCVHLR